MKASPSDSTYVSNDPLSEIVFLNTLTTGIQFSKILGPNMPAFDVPFESSEIHTIVQDLRYYANWNYHCIHQIVNIPLPISYCILLGRRSENHNLSLRRAPVIDINTHRHFIEIVIARANNYQLPLSNITNLAVINISVPALNQPFASKKYDHQIAYAKLFLTS